MYACVLSPHACGADDVFNIASCLTVDFSFICVNENFILVFEVIYTYFFNSQV